MKFANGMSVLALFTGIWVMLSLYLLGFAPAYGDPWTAMVLGTDILGMLIIVAAVVGLVGFWSLQ